MTQPLRRNRVFIVLVLLSLFAAGIRFIKLGEIPGSPYWDEASIGYEALSVANTGHDSHGLPWLQPLFPAYGDYKAPVYIWLTAVVVKIHGLSLWSTRFISALAGSSMPVLMYFLLNELVRKQNATIISLLGAMFVAIAPWSIQFSRAAFEANLGLSLGLASLILLLKSRKNPWLIPLSALLASGSIYAYVSNRFVIPCMFVTVLIWARKQFIPHFAWIGVGLLTGAILLIPLITSPQYQVSNQYRMSTPNLLTDPTPVLQAQAKRDEFGSNFLHRLIYHRYWYRMIQLTKQIATLTSPQFLFFTGDPNLRHGTGRMGLFYPAWLPLMLLGIVWSWRFDKKLLWLVGMGIGASILPAVIPLETPHALRSLNALPWYITLIALGGGYLIKMSRLKRHFILLTLLFFGISLLQVYNFISYYFGGYQQASYKAWTLAYAQAAQFATAHTSEYQQIWAQIGDDFEEYLLFYSQYPPEKLQKLARTNQLSFGFNMRFYEFEPFATGISTEKAWQTKEKTLYFTTKERLPNNITPVAEFPIGALQPDFVAVSLPVEQK